MWNKSGSVNGPCIAYRDEHPDGLTSPVTKDLPVAVLQVVCPGQRVAGVKMAALYRHGAPHFDWQRDNTIGATH